MYPNQFVAADAALNLSGFAKIYMTADPVDLRKGIDGYASIIQNSFRLSPFEDTAIFLFTNKYKNKIKALCYNGVGFWLLYFRLGKGKFKWQTPGSGKYASITTKQLHRLLEGKTPEPESSFPIKKPRYI